MDSQEREHINFWLIYSDLFSGLLVLLVGLLMISSALGRKAGEGSEEFKQRRDAQLGLTKQIVEQTTRLGYRAEPNSSTEIESRFDGAGASGLPLVRIVDTSGRDAVVIHRPEGEEQRIAFGSQVLFDERGVHIKDLKDAGRDLLRRLGPIILAQQELYSEIRVLGHTDAQPASLGDSLRFNWELSGSRAVAVVVALLTDPVIGEKLSGEQYRLYGGKGETRFNFPPNRISVIGRGEFEPVGSLPNDNWVVRRDKIYESWGDTTKLSENRRIEIILRFVPLTTVQGKG